MRYLAAAVGILTLLAGAASGEPLAAASPSPYGNCITGLGQTAVDCGGSTNVGSDGGVVLEQPTAGGDAQASSRPINQQVFEYAQVQYGADNGQNCWIDVPISYANALPGTLQFLQVMSNVNRNANPPCPAQPPHPAPIVLSPQQLAQQFWDTIPLPRPAPGVPPGYAITGKTAYLLAGDSNAPAPYTRQTPIGLLTVVAHGTYTVDWGDGGGSDVTGPYTTAGAGYPSGTITHTYDDVGRYTITVRETWSATWSIGPAHGVLNALHTTGTIPGFTVRQVQAVITG
jgi:hypothetical protein